MATIDYGKYYTYKELEYELKTLCDKYPDMMKLDTLAVTEEGRNVYVAEVTRNVHSSETEEKGGYYVQSSVHSSEPAGGTVSLCLLETLLSENPDILDDVVFIKQGQIVLQMSVDDIREKHGKTVDAYFREVFAC